MSRSKSEPHPACRCFLSGCNLSAENLMHYYQFNIGDYKSHTEHLSEMEDLTYRRLLDWYYLHETPIPLDLIEVARKIRMRSHSDCIALVLQEYFERTDDGWIHHRANAEIAKAGEKSEKASASAKARWNKVSDANALRAQSESNATQDTRHITHNTEHIYLEPTVLVPSPKVERTPAAPISEIVELFNAKLPQLPRCEVVNDARKRTISARWREVVAEQKFTKDQGLEWFGNFFDHVRGSNFLTGKVKDWKADIDFIFTPTKFARIVEGAYHKD